MKDTGTTRCGSCGKEASPWALTSCPICGKMVCRRCGVSDYGRTFCSRDCAVLFFYGDDEDELPEEGS